MNEHIRMIVLDNRQAWLDHRKKYIGGSDVSAIVGVNPYKNNQQLWEEKTGRREAEDISERPLVKYGTEAENYLRELFRLDFPEYDLRYVGNNSFLNDKYPFAAASLDGWLFDKDGRLGIWECKTSTIQNANQWKIWDGCIPDYYYTQCLYYMGVLEADFCMLKAQLKSIRTDDLPRISTRHYVFERSEVQEDIDYIMQEAAEFYERVKSGKCPDLILPSII